MGKIILVTGGARSGKSSFAEEFAGKLGRNILYIATATPFDDEMKDRIRKHRKQRPSNWTTVETYKDMDVILKFAMDDKNAALLDCITIMISNIMFERNTDDEALDTELIDRVEAAVKNEIDKLLKVIDTAEIPFILVTNEIGMGIVPDNALARVFRDIAGRTNQLLAKAADEVYLCVSGIPVKIK